MLDLRTGSVMQTFPDIQNFRLPAASLISPCGTWVLGGSHCGVSVTEYGGKSKQKNNKSSYFGVKHNPINFKHEGLYCTVPY